MLIYARFLVRFNQPLGCPPCSYQRFSTTRACFSFSTATNGPVEAKYKDLVRSGAIKHNDLQFAVVRRMQGIFDELSSYAADMNEWTIKLNEYEAKLAKRIQELAMEESASKEPLKTAKFKASNTSSWSLSWLLPQASAPSNLTPDQKERLRCLDRELRALKELGPSPSPPSPTKGIYIHGSVGSGKTRMMDLFFSCISASDVGKLLTGGHKRVHFNQAMLSIHERIHKESSTPHQDKREAQIQEEEEEEEESLNASHNRNGIFRYWGDQTARNQASKLAFLSIRKHLRLARSGKVSKTSLAKANSHQLSSVARTFLLQSGSNDSKDQEVIKPSLLAFDEVQICDPFTAATLKALFEGLTASGCVLILTSNRAPRELPRHGLHEDMFESLIATIEDRCHIVDLSSQDYRRSILEGKGITTGVETSQSYFHPLTDEASNARFNDQWRAIAPTPSPITIPVQFGRTLLAPLAQNGSARFVFEDLCAMPLGPADFVSIASHFHTVFLDGVPVFSMNIKDQARRFITLIDELYNAKTRLFIRAASEPDQLFKGGSSTRLEPSESVVDLEGLQFEGTVEGGRLRRNVLGEGGVAPVAATDRERIAAQLHLGGNEERFAFARAISRLYEMTSSLNRS